MKVCFKKIWSIAKDNYRITLTIIIIIPVLFLWYKNLEFVHTWPLTVLLLLIYISIVFILLPNLPWMWRRVSKQRLSLYTQILSEEYRTHLYTIGFLFIVLIPMLFLVYHDYIIEKMQGLTWSMLGTISTLLLAGLSFIILFFSVRTNRLQLRVNKLISQPNLIVKERYHKSGNSLEIINEGGQTAYLKEMTFSCFLQKAHLKFSFKIDKTMGPGADFNIDGLEFQTATVEDSLRFSMSNKREFLIKVSGKYYYLEDPSEHDCPRKDIRYRGYINRKFKIYDTILMFIEYRYLKFGPPEILEEQRIFLEELRCILEKNREKLEETKENSEEAREKLEETKENLEGLKGERFDAISKDLKRLEERERELGEELRGVEKEVREGEERWENQMKELEGWQVKMEKFAKETIESLRKEMKK